MLSWFLLRSLQRTKEYTINIETLSACLVTSIENHEGFIRKKVLWVSLILGVEPSITCAYQVSEETRCNDPHPNIDYTCADKKKLAS